MKFSAKVFCLSSILTIVLLSCKGYNSLTTGVPSDLPQRITYYSFVAEPIDAAPEGSVIIMPNSYILPPVQSDSAISGDAAKDLRAALEDALNDSRNGWKSDELEISEVTLTDGHANVVLKGEYFGVGDVTLIAASMQILLTIFANVEVQDATVMLNGDTIGNMGLSHSMNARPSNYVFTRTEIEAYIKDHAYGSP